MEYINLSEYLPLGYYQDEEGVKLYADPDVAAAAAAEAAVSSRQQPHAPQ